MQLRLLLLAAALLAVPAAAHGEHEADCDRRADTWTHLGLWEPELAPGEAAERTLSFEGCPLEEGWRFLLRGAVAGEVRVTLRQSEVEVGSWTWSGDDHLEVVTLPHTDFLHLRLENVGDGAGNATARLYFDQTCLCTVKGSFLVPGPVWLSALADAGDRVSFNVTVAPSGSEPEPPETVTVRAVVPGRPEATRNWTFHPGSDPACHDGARWTGCLDYSLRAPSDGRQDVLLWLDHDGGEAWSLSVRPVIEVHAGRDAPGPSAWVLPLVLAAAAAAVRRAR